MMSSGNIATYLLRKDEKLYVWGYNFDHFIDNSDNLIVQYTEVQ